MPRNTAVRQAANREVSISPGEHTTDELGLSLREHDAVDECELVENDGGVSFRSAGERELRPYGSSTRFTFTRTSLELSGFTETETVRVYARDGAILLVSGESDGGAEEPGEYLELVLDTQGVPNEVADLLDEYDANIRPATVRCDDGLRFALDVPTEFDYVTERDVRPFGDSTAFTLPPSSLDTAGLTEGDPVNVGATEGAVLVLKA